MPPLDTKFSLEEAAAQFRPASGADDSGIISAMPDALPALSVKLMESSADCIKVLEADGRLSYMSCNGMKAMEIDDFDAVRDAPWPDLWPEQHRPLLAQALARARNGETTEFEANCPTAKGTDKWWSVTVMPVLNRSGALDRIVATSRDITERVNAAEELRLVGAELAREALRTKALLSERDHLIAEMDHRIKNSLSMVSSLMRMHGRDTDSEEARRLLEQASTQVMAISRVHEALQRRSGDEWVDAGAFLDMLMSDLSSVIGGSIALRHSATRGLQLSGSQAAQTGLVAVELVLNAQKHAETAAPDVQIMLEPLGAGGGFRLVVEDDGPGLPDGFDLDAATGLGLRVCRSCAAQMGGALLAGAGADRGARFEMRVPGAASDGAANGAALG